MPSKRKNSRLYMRLYMRRYRSLGFKPAEPRPPYLQPATADEIQGAKQSLLSAHRLRTIGVVPK